MLFKNVIKSKFPRFYNFIKYAVKYSILFINSAVKYLALFFEHIIIRKPLKTRDDLPLLLNVLNLNGKGVEIGTWKGEYSTHVLTISKLSTLYSIDPWQHFGDCIYIDIDNVSSEEFEVIYNQAIKALGKFGNRSKVMRMSSINAIKAFKDCSLDFIYLDANHSYESCKEDLKLWWPKLKKGGMFAGHDYLDADLPQGKYGVKSAVNEFLKVYPHKLFVTPEAWPTWYFIKQ